jgi:hypothetical protein
LERESPVATKEPSPAAPDSLSKVSEKVIQNIDPKPAGLKALGHPLPENWTPDDELCEDVKRDFGMSDDDIRTELLGFHARHAAEGSFSANWRASFVTWCKRWKENRDKQAPPRVELTKPPPSRPEEFSEATWDGMARFYAQTGRWARDAGPDPMSPACKCPTAILERHGINLETGERIYPSRVRT